MDLGTSSESEDEFVAVQVAEDESLGEIEAIHESNDEEMSPVEGELLGSEDGRNSVSAVADGSPMAEMSEETIPYDVEEANESPAHLETGVEAENDADSESSELVSEAGTPTPPPRKSARGRIPKSIFTYDDHGNPIIVQQ